MTSEKSILKVDLQVCQRKLQRKEEKIAQLEKHMITSREKQQEYLNIIKQLKHEFIKVQSQQMMQQQIVQENERQGGKIIGGPRDRKTVRGGGGRIKNPTPRIGEF